MYQGGKPKTSWCAGGEGVVVGSWWAVGAGSGPGGRGLCSDGPPSPGARQTLPRLHRVAPQVPIHLLLSLCQNQIFIHHLVPVEQMIILKMYSLPRSRKTITLKHTIIRLI